jgi:hypothetical protein
MNSSDPPAKLVAKVRKRALSFRTFLGTNPKTGRQKKAHARTMALVTNPDLFDAQEQVHLSKLQRKRLRLKKAKQRNDAKTVD